MKKLALSLFVSALLIIFPIVAIAQDPTPTPSAEEQRLEQENRILKLQKDNATLKNDIRTAVLSPTATPLDGKVELTEVTMEPQMMSYNAMTTTCDCIAKRISEHFGKAIVIAIYEPAAVAGLKYYRFSYPIFDSKLSGIEFRYGQMLPSAPQPVGPLAALPIAKDALRAFADVLALFRTDIKIEGKTVSINQKALNAEILYALSERYGHRIVLYDPGSFSPDESAGLDSTGKFKSQILGSIATGYELRNRANVEIGRLSSDILKANVDLNRVKKETDAVITKLTEQVAALEAELKKSNKAKKQKELAGKIQAAKDSVQDEKLKLEEAQFIKDGLELKRTTFLDLNKDFDSLISELTAVNEKTGSNDLLTFLKGESLAEVLGGDSSGNIAKTNDPAYYWLDIASVTAGGNNRTQKSLLTFFTGNKIDHSGGIIVAWQLLNPRWQIVDGRKIQVYEGYKSAKSILKMRSESPKSDRSPQECGYPK